jgi:hypothetical protein
MKARIVSSFTAALVITMLLLAVAAPLGCPPGS